jgi:hypothetical protein
MSLIRKESTRDGWFFFVEKNVEFCKMQNILSFKVGFNRKSNNNRINNFLNIKVERPLYNQI